MKCFFAAVLIGSTAALSAPDLGRARQRKPRDQYRGHGTLSSANAKLNVHLTSRPELNTTECEKLSREDLQTTLIKLFKARDEELVAVYPKGDGRHSAYDSEEQMTEQWEKLTDDVEGRQRDAFCHEAVMWFTHHLTTPAQLEFAKIQSVPLLPVRQHNVGGEDESTKLYASKVTCQKCHVGGIDNLHVPEVKPETPQNLARRCYTNYKDLFNITCGPCDGISGIYRGDDDEYFTAPECSIVSLPENVPESERVPVKLPNQFTVDVEGSDRFGRTTNPGHSNIIARTYGQIKGKWYMNAVPGADQWFLRHDTTYKGLSLDGHDIPFLHSASVSEIHVQSTNQKKANVTGAMVSLVKGLPSWIPGGCTCIPDPVGVPDITATEATGLADAMEYMGRINIKMEYSGEYVELDHWANWFFHIFMGTDKNHYTYAKAPRRLASAYAGMAVYTNWSFADPTIARPDVWHDGIPTEPERVGPDHGKFCLNPKKVEQCNDISQSTYPPPVNAPAPNLATVSMKSSIAPGFFPMKPDLDEALHQEYQRMGSNFMTNPSQILV